MYSPTVASSKSVRTAVTTCTPLIRRDELRPTVRLVSSILSANFGIG